METHLKMTFIVALALFVSVVYSAKSQDCPAKYLRLNPEHSFCKGPNPECSMTRRGVSDKEIKEILDVHNKYRSEVATGKEANAGGLPTASDMLQMVWDTELATIAQRRAEQCIYAHDCSDCRSVENFAVGQNIAYRDTSCWGGKTCDENPAADWQSIIKMFYDEVSVFNKAYVNAISFSSGVKYGHFTQIVWSRTWRLGCGFVTFKQQSGYRNLYVCNYGPTGNMISEPLYKEGAPCVSCPENSCCGTNCSETTYPGLCKMLRDDVAPTYPREGDYLTYCQFENSHGDCEVTVAGTPKWNLKKALGGPYAEIILNGGESSILSLKKLVQPTNNFCLFLKYRSTPLVSGQTSASSAVVILERAKSGTTEMNLPLHQKHHFFSYDIDIGWNFPTKVSVQFKVPEGAPAQCFDVSEISAKEGNCIRKKKFGL